MVGRVPGRAVGAVFVVVCVLAGAGCVGATDRGDFDRLMKERNRGLPASLPNRAIDAAARAAGTGDVSLRRLEVDGTARTVTLQVRGDSDEAVDQYTYHDGTLSAAQSVPASSFVPIEDQVFDADAVTALDDVRALVDRTLDELDLPEGIVDRLTVAREGGAAVRVSIHATDEDHETDGTAEFAADGTFLSAATS